MTPAGADSRSRAVRRTGSAQAFRSCPSTLSSFRRWTSRSSAALALLQGCPCRTSNKERHDVVVSRRMRGSCARSELARLRRAGLPQALRVLPQGLLVLLAELRVSRAVRLVPAPAVDVDSRLPA